MNANANSVTPISSAARALAPKAIFLVDTWTIKASVPEVLAG
jgi:hypothetical protein